MTNKNLILGVGRAFTDVIADVDDAFLERFGLEKGIGARLPQARLADILAALDRPVYMAGGSIANTIAGLNALGAKTAFIGKIGDDAAGAAFATEFEKTGVRFDNPPVKNSPSGTCLCLNTPDGERTFAFAVGVCEDLSPEDIPPALINEASMMLLQVMMLETHICYETMAHVLPMLPPHVRRVMCLHDLQDQGKVSDLVLSHVDIVIGSRVEFAYIMDIHTEAELTQKMRQMAILGVMTKGEEGAFLTSPHESVNVSAVRPAKMIDTVGAGDLFATGLLYGLTQGYKLGDAGHLGAQCAALIIEEVGGRPSPQCAEKMKKLIS